MAEDREQGFLSRWSRRKREIAAEEGDEARLERVHAEPETDDAQVAHAETAAEETEEEAANREAAESVDLEALTYESDFSIFMKSGVPAMLRKQAMRKLWSSNPILANIDGLNDYDEDFADPALNVFKSNWQVGRGFLTEEDRKPKSKYIAEEPESIDQHDVSETGVEQQDDVAGPEPEETEAAPELTAENESLPMETVSQLEPDSHEQEGPPPARRVSLRRRLLED